MTFKQFINEAKALDYYDPPARAKFQKGDFVVIRDYNSHWNTQQPKKTIQYLNNVGEVVGYKNSPGAYSKFALKLPDGNIAMFHGHFLYGPFKDLKTASKYTDPKKDISSADIKVKTTVKSYTEYEINEGVENFIKTFVPKIGYKLLPKPVEVLSEDGRYVYTVFATRDVEFCNDDRHYEPSPIPGKYCCYRINSPRSKKLKPTRGSAINSIVKRSAEVGGISYFIEAPRPNNGYNGIFGATISRDNFFQRQVYGITGGPVEEVGLFNYFKNYDKTIVELRLGKYKTDIELVSYVYNVQGDTISAKDKDDAKAVIYQKLKLNDPYFYKNYKIDGDFIYAINDDDTGVTDFSVLPKEITRDLKIANSIVYRIGNRNLKFKNLKGMTQLIGRNIEIIGIGVESLEGAPKVVNGDFNCAANPLKNFIGGPKKVNGWFGFGNCEQLTSLQGIPEANEYHYYDAFLNGKHVTEKDIEIAFIKHSINPETLKNFEELLDEL